MNYHFNTTSFIAAWCEWIEYKRVQHRFKFKSEKYEQIALNKLVKISGGDEATAIEIIHNSIGNGYSGLFPLKQKVNGKNNKTNTGRYTATGDGGY